jgi:hypothetical protein
MKHFSQIMPLKKLKFILYKKLTFNFFKGAICEKCFICSMPVIT